VFAFQSNCNSGVKKQKALFSVKKAFVDFVEHFPQQKQIPLRDISHVFRVSVHEKI